MLGFGWHAWDDERCPYGARFNPPLYGNFNTDYVQVPQNSPRLNGEDQVDAVKVAVPWKAGIPRGNDICIKSSSRAKQENNNIAPVQKRFSPKQQRHNHRPPIPNNNHDPSLNGNFTKQSESKCPCDSQSYLPPLKSKSATECNVNDKKKQFYNVMWDPRVVHGSTMIHFEEAQRAKWKRQVDSFQAMQLREQIRRRRKKMKEEKYLDTKSNPTRRIIYPSVTITKEPLTNSSFALFLTEQGEAVECVNAGQDTDDVRPPLGQNKMAFSSGISASVQTEGSPASGLRQETVDWLAKTMIEKIPEQAVLEVQEEAELEMVKGEQKRYELVFLYRKWQEMKENQWKEYLRAWNEIRMREILDQNAHLQTQQKRIAVIGFCTNAISSCFDTTFQRMMQDGFINKHGIPYEELEEFEASMDYRSEAEEKFARKQLLARKIVDSTLINAAVQRFSVHMFDDYGRPHGAWLYKRGRHDTIDYDIDLQLYLESRWMKRREWSAREGSVNALYSESGLLNIFDFYKHSGLLGEGRRATQGQPEAGVIPGEKPISKQRFKPSTAKVKSTVSDGTTPDNKSINEGDEQRKLSNDDDDVSTIYKTKMRWSKVDVGDENYAIQQTGQQKKNSGERGLRLDSLAKGARSRTIGLGTNQSGGSQNPGKREEVDSDKLGVVDGNASEKRRSGQSSSATDMARQSQNSQPHTRFK